MMPRLCELALQKYPFFFIFRDLKENLLLLDLKILVNLNSSDDQTQRTLFSPDF